MVTTQDEYIAARARLVKRYRAAVKRGDLATASIHREHIDLLTREINR